MSATPSLWSRWVRRLDHREPATGLALLRICMGLVLFMEVGTVWWADLIDVLWFGIDDGGYRPAGTTGSWLIKRLGGPSPAVIYGLIATALVGASGLVLGVLPRVAAFLGLQAFLALGWNNVHAGGSYDPLITNILWLLVLADSGSTGSVTAWRKTGRWWPDTQALAWPRYLVVGQMVTLYTSTGLQKVSATWVPGGDLSALYYILQQPTWQRFDMSGAAWVFPLTQLVTLLTWIFEVGAPILVLAFWYRATSTRPGRLRAWFNRVDLRAIWLGFGAVMHVGIMLLMDVGTFSLVCLASYFCFFHADELRRFPVLRRWLPPPNPPETGFPRTA